MPRKTVGDSAIHVLQDAGKVTSYRSSQVLKMQYMDLDSIESSPLEAQNALLL